MNRVLISGYYGFANAGDEAMLSAIIASLKDINANIEIVVISGNPQVTAQAYNIKAIPRFSLWQIVKQLFKAELLISGGGSLLQDVTSERSLYYYLSIIQLAKLFGKKTMLYGQGIGPLHGKLAKKITAFVCKQADCVTVRDSGSALELEDLGLDKSQLVVTADPVFAMHAVSRDLGRRILQKHNFQGAKPVVGISVRPWLKLENYKVILAEVADYVVDKHDARVVFLPMHYPQDLKVSQEIAELMQHKESSLVLEDLYSTEEFLSVIGNFDLLIGVRLHALIFAAVMQVPIIGISYDPKIDRFLQGVQTTAVACLDTLSLDVLIEKVDSVLKNIEQERELQSNCVKKLREAAQENARIAVDLLLRK